MTGKHEPPWHEQDEFWAFLAPRLFDQRRLGNTYEEVDSLLELLGLAPGAKVLDLCCGPGRHALELSRRGYAVTGVDRTDSYLSEARSRAETEGLNTRFVHADMREFRKAGCYDGVINMFTSFGLFEDQDDDRRVLANIRDSLRPGGVLVMELVGSPYDENAERLVARAQVEL